MWWYSYEKVWKLKFELNVIFICYKILLFFRFKKKPLKNVHRLYEAPQTVFANPGSTELPE